MKKVVLMGVPHHNNLGDNDKINIRKRKGTNKYEKCN